MIFEKGEKDGMHLLPRNDEKKKAPYPIGRKGYHLLLNAIPAWGCGQCGEVYFEEEEVEFIQDV